MKETNEKSTQQDYIEKVWIAVGIVSLTAISLLILEATFNVFLLLFAGILIAVFFTGLSQLIHRKTNWNQKVCLGISVLGSILLVIGFFWLIGAQIQTQVDELSETLPKTIEKAKDQLKESSIGDKLLERATSKESGQKAQEFAATFFRSTFGGFGDIYVVLFIGIFLTLAPNTYLNGVKQLVPKKGQATAEKIFIKLGEQLRNWMKGQLFSMSIVSVLTAIGLAILGIPLWLVLALLAGLLSFIPNFGPLLALIPAILVGLMESPQTALWVIGLYVLIQFVESNFITTLIQQKMIAMPPALIIFSQMLLGALTGSWGLVLSTPLTVVLIVLIKHLYTDREEE